MSLLSLCAPIRESLKLYIFSHSYDLSKYVLCVAANDVISSQLCICDLFFCFNSCTWKSLKHMHVYMQKKRSQICHARSRGEIPSMKPANFFFSFLNNFFCTSYILYHLRNSTPRKFMCRSHAIFCPYSLLFGSFSFGWLRRFSVGDPNFDAI